MDKPIPEVVKNTARNIHELLVQIAVHIEKLEVENKTLKEENESLRSGNKAGEA